MELARPDPIVITGCGWVTPFAAGEISEILSADQACPAPGTLEQGYWPIPEDCLAGYPQLSAEIRQDKGAWIAAIAFEHSRRQAAPPDSLPAERVGMVLGCALAGQLGMIAFANEVRAQSARFVSPIHFPQTVGNYIAGALARAYNIRGPNITLACGLASGLDAIAQGCALLAAGSADLV
jgi:3-oxoacyl-(acyl-carrier-protein) synthase